MMLDPIVDEVRTIREQLAAQLDFDIRRIIADAQQRQSASGRRVVSFEHLPRSDQQDPQSEPAARADRT